MPLVNFSEIMCEWARVCAVRSANPYVTYFEAAASRVNVAEKFVMCESSRLVATNVARLRFRVPYEHLVVAVGEQPATFGVPGVRDHAFFMKEVSDSVRLRKRIATQFEAAEFLTDEEELRGALRFVVVGGGPTGVEFAGTMSDFLFNEVLRNYRHMMPFTEVCLVQSGGSILPAFDKVLQDRAAENLATLNVHVMTGVRVRLRCCGTCMARGHRPMHRSRSRHVNCEMISISGHTQPLCKRYAQIPGSTLQHI